MNQSLKKLNQRCHNHRWWLPAASWPFPIPRCYDLWRWKMWGRHEIQVRNGKKRSVRMRIGTHMEEQSDHVIHQAMPTKILGLPCWNLWSWGCEAWSFGKWEQQRRLLSFETICYSRVMRVLWTAKRRNEDILEEVGGRQLWNSVVARKLRYFGRIMTKEDENLEKCIITGMAEGTRGRRRPRRAWSDDIKEWTHLSTEEALQLTRDHAAWRSVVHHAANVHDSE